MQIGSGLSMTRAASRGELVEHNVVVDEDDVLVDGENVIVKVRE